MIKSHSLQLAKQMGYYNFLWKKLVTQKVVDKIEEDINSQTTIILINQGKIIAIQTVQIFEGVDRELFVKLT